MEVGVEVLLAIAAFCNVALGLILSDAGAPSGSPPVEFERAGSAGRLNGELVGIELELGLAEKYPVAVERFPVGEGLEIASTSLSSSLVILTI